MLLLLYIQYSIEGVIVDIMPTDSSVIGFSNRWYKEGFQNAELKSIGENESVCIPIRVFDCYKA